ncbi:aldehyde dehydrogenase family protein [Granulicoccus sp. GXG6511]|uniref:aldehyde dehydrogenase family protein n=1 Tax=Granulicoccus sp. GXG6511 TaxID=3381351 RepID=UPI003D7E9DBE
MPLPPTGPSADERHPLSDAIDQAVRRLADGAGRWVDRSLASRAALIRATHATIAESAEAWTAAAVTAKGDPGAQVEAEEWLSGPYAALGGFLGIAESLELLAAGRSPAAGLRVGTAPGGRVTLRVLPGNARDWTLLNGFTADVWLRPGVSLDQAQKTAGLEARQPCGHGGVATVLGAGNVTSIGPLDVLNQLVAHNRASVLKVNPVLGGMLPVYRQALAPLIDADLLWLIAGGAEVGDMLVHHPGISHVHLTGNRRTHDAIVWGVDEEAERRRAANQPAITTSVSSELGCVSPCIVVPGEWSRADLRYQAEQVVSQRLHNAGHNCIATQVLITSSDWPQRADFLTEIRKVLHRLPHRSPWYPGSAQAMAQLSETHLQAELHDGCYLVDLPARHSDDLFEKEFFGPALAHTTLPGTGSAYLREATNFANDRLDGTLGAAIIVAPETRRAMGPAFDETIAQLRYGAIGINVWTGFIFALQSAPWGAYPGHSLDDPGSGMGVVHNSFLLAGTERVVAEGPFRPFPQSLALLRHGRLALFPKPQWFVTSRSAVETGRRMVEYAKNPAWSRLLRVLPAAFRS